MSPLEKPSPKWSSPAYHQFTRTGIHPTSPASGLHLHVVRSSSNSSNMQVAIQAQPSNESLPSYNAVTPAATLPEYTLTNLSPPAKAHTRVTHTQAANPPVDYVEAQPHLDFDAEANIVRNNAPNVSTADFHNLPCTFLYQLCCPRSFARIRSPSVAAANFGCA